MLRYQSQMQLPQIGFKGQQALQRSKIICIGAGGLGSSVLYYLTGAGVGNIQICDNDEVSLSNLHRQILYTEKDVGENKSLAAVARLQLLNSQIDLQALPVVMNAKNVLSIIQDRDIIVDATDNIQSKLILNDACHYLRKPLVTASIYQYQGQCAVLHYPNTPCLRCIYEDNLQINCDCQDGVLGMVPGLLGMLQALETIKLILKFPQSLLGKWWHWDLSRGIPSEYTLVSSPDCPLCTCKENFVTLWNEEKPAQELTMKGITVKELATKLTNKEDIFILDVRNPDEYALFNLGGHLCPLSELPERINELPRDKLIIVHCRSGHRSQTAIEFLQRVGFSTLQNLIGGVLAWQQEIGMPLEIC